MKLSWKIYLILFGVFLCSVCMPIVFPSALYSREIAIIPGSISLLGILYQLFRDETKYQKDLLLQRDQQLFDLGATSHIANVAFDKHVIFCEEYVSVMHETITSLYREGPSPQALVQANKLYQIQRKYAVWLTPQIEKDLEPFERALRKIGATAQNRRNGNSSGKINEMYDVFSDILGIQKENQVVADEQVAVTTIITKLRKVLGIEEITLLRQRIISDNPLIISTIKKPI